MAGWNLKDVVTLTVAVLIPLSGGFLGASTTASQIKGWYAKLRKPSWTPPNWLFGPAWTTLYVLMGSASWMVWKQGGLAAQARPLGLYALSLVSNFLWTPLFFGAHRMDLALVDITVMLGLEAATLNAFSKVIGPRAATLTLGPLIAWTSYATALNYAVLTMNPTPPPATPADAAAGKGGAAAETAAKTTKAA